VSGPCLDNNLLSELACGAAADEARARAMDHIDSCSTCCALLALAATGETTGAMLREGTRLDRYIIVRPVGAGAMGLVYEAYQPHLHRRVALKLARVSGDRGLRGRLVHEARAIAAISHPNVVTVYDAGALDDRVYVAMEYLEGGTLTEWLTRQPRTARDILAIFRQAGEGLAAAHAAGLVHRDFKPDNVLIGRDGRARVTDFGLARGVDGGRHAYPDALLVPGRRLVGTPAYMAPEQHERAAVDARADQYAFAVSLYEALFGHRPSPAARTLGGPDDARQGERRLAARGDRRALTRVKRILARALRTAPEARFAGMREFLDELWDVDAVRGRARYCALLAVPVLLFAIAWVFWVASTSQR